MTFTKPVFTDRILVVQLRYYVGMKQVRVIHPLAMSTSFNSEVIVLLQVFLM